MLLTATVSPVEPATGQIWLWVFAASTVILLAATAYLNFRLTQSRRHAARAAHHQAGLLDEARADTARAEAQTERLRTALAERDRAAKAVTEEVLPLVMQRVREGASPDTVLAELGEPDPATHPLTESVTRSLWRGHQQRRRLLSVVKGCADRARAGVAQLRAEVQERSQPYWKSLDTTGAGDRMREDFMVMEAGLSRLEMLIQRLLTVAEADRIGRNWTRPLRIERLVRAAIGSVPEFARVQMHPPATPMVVEGRAVNSIIQVLAELIDNATSFSAPSEAVVVHYETTAMRLGIHIDDSGLAMTEEQLADVRRRLDPSRPPDITELSANQLGLLVVRRAADPLNIRVDLGPSPRGGTRATVWIPRNGLLRTDEEALTRSSSLPGSGEIPSVPVPVPAPASQAPTVPTPVAPEPARLSVVEHTTEEAEERPRRLPRRRRGATLPDEDTKPKTVEAPRDTAAAGRRIAQWHAHTRPTPVPPAENREDS